ncbi:DUF4136 domain-containing protein [Mucilaginibacter gotjawali]|uniref:Uncharacterized protein n=2 Tax=Mucilaginibacter gotjawali TaxID=1550579 RepID=A0A0X8X3I7_9SPHI|nr:DUF4136 domain-containing protein [Mucilaginibacter gotjawali]MBB3056360.1 hypothetical protein [Mucilaginibacter gotjawali]BAU55065.1 hypothetical protein MgSA37_03246 [Mucilaginibacter gotjawali]
MKNLIKVYFLLLLVYSLSGCSGYQYYAVQSTGATFAKYHTFAWLPSTDTAKTNGYTDITDEKIKEVATENLESRGLLLKAGRPDLLVRYSIAINNKVKYYNNPVYIYNGGYYPGIARYRHGRYYYFTYRQPLPVYVGSEIEQVPYKEGTLIIDLIDRKTRHVIWRGYGRGEIENPEKAIHDIPEVVGGIINKLPLKPVEK